MGRKIVTPEPPPTKVDNAEGSSDAQKARAYLKLEQLAEKAQGDLATFFDLAIRHEITKKRLNVAPHQRIMFSFIQAHDHAVVRTPTDTSKTFSAATVALWLIGNDVTHRGAIVSHSVEQAKKILKMVANYIEDPDLGAGVRAVFPHLRPSPRSSDSWKLTEITVDRPPGTRDPTLRAIGINTKIHGSRLSWFLCDDLIDDTNAYSPIEREKLKRAFTERLISRLDPDRPTKAILTNTPWDKDDLTYVLEANGWPTLTMDIRGNIRFSNASETWVRDVLDNHLRPSSKDHGAHDWYRLRAHDPDPDEVVPLWPERQSTEKIDHWEAGGDGWLPHAFARLKMCAPFDEDAARCQREWIEACKQPDARLVPEYHGSNPTFTGVDLAIGKKKTDDKTVLFTIELHADGTRQILDIDSGRLTGPEIVDRIIDKADRYGSAVIVETNQGQEYVRQFAQDARKDLRIIAHSTQRSNKAHQEFGVESIFAEIRNGAWVIPCRRDGTCSHEVQEWINECVYYNPDDHTGDYLMASWMATSQARRGRRGGASDGAGVGRRREGLKTGGY